MKRIPIVEVKNFRGGSLGIPRFDATGQIIGEIVHGPDGQPIIDPQTGEPIKRMVSPPGTIIDAIDFLIQDFPQAKLSMKNIAEGTRIAGLIAECREKKSEALVLEEASYEWLFVVLKDERIGVPMFGMNLPGILAALENHG